MPVLAMAVIILYAASYLSLADNTKKTAVLHAHRVQAYYIAEAAVEMALGRLRENPNWSVWAPGFSQPVEFAEGRINSIQVTTVSKVGNTTTVDITGVGSYKEAKKTLVVRARLVSEEEGIRVVIVNWREKHPAF